jgi:hypothetical protein
MIRSAASVRAEAVEAHFFSSAGEDGSEGFDKLSPNGISLSRTDA